MALTIKQKLFVEHYLETRNAFRAAKLAGYAGNDRTLRQAGSENLAKPDIIAEIDNRLKPFILSANRVLAGLSAIADIDVGDVFEDDGSFSLAKAKERGITRLIKSLAYDKDTGRITKVELHSAHEALRDLGKHFGLFPNNLKLSIEDADKAIDSAISAHSLPKPESFAGEPMLDSEM